MVSETSDRVSDKSRALHHENHIDEMTEKLLSLTPNPPRIPVFYTLTKIHKPNPVRRPIIFGCENPTEQMSSFVDYLLQPIAKLKSYLKDAGEDTTDFLNFIDCIECFHDVTTAMLVSQTKPLGIELYFYANTFFCFSKPIWPVVT